MTKQTALAHWTTPHGKDRYLIFADQWQKGQDWTRSLYVGPSPNGGLSSPYSPDIPDLPIIVAELLDIPEPLPEVVWLDGYPIAWLNTIPKGTEFRAVADGHTPVIVMAWPGGTRPTREDNR